MHDWSVFLYPVYNVCAVLNRNAFENAVINEFSSFLSRKFNLFNNKTKI